MDRVARDGDNYLPDGHQRPLWIFQGKGAGFEHGTCKRVESMSALDYMIAAEGQLLLADSNITPNCQEDEASAHLHTAMVHLEFAIAVARGHQFLPDPAEIPSAK